MNMSARRLVAMDAIIANPHGAPARDWLRTY
jgi:hypothetical protein